MSSATERLDEKYYPHFGDSWDNALFRQRILARLTSKAEILDVGAGAGIVPQMDFRGAAARICGIDLDPRVTANQFLDEGLIADASAIPYPDCAFDLVFSDNVLEHLSAPLEVFTEVARVLRPGGHFLFKTPNKWHYIPLIARLTPHKFHQYANRARGRPAEDTFPTLYRANSRRTVRRLAAKASLEVEALELVEGRPEYLRFHPIPYLFGLSYERAVNAIPLLEGMRVVMIGSLRKPKNERLE